MTALTSVVPAPAIALVVSFVVAVAVLTLAKCKADREIYRIYRRIHSIKRIRRTMASQERYEGQGGLYGSGRYSQSAPLERQGWR